MKPTKKIFLVATEFLLSLFLASCTPDSRVTLQPTNAFDINISVLSNYERMDTVKTVVVDGDSISFNLLNSEDIVSSPMGTSLTLSVNSPNYEILRVKIYPYNYATHMIDSTYALNNLDVIPGGILINNSYTVNTWDTLYYLSPDMAATYGLPEYSDKYISLPPIVLHSGIDGTPWIKYDMPENTDQYIMLRKRMNTQYQYYWIRTRNETVYSSDSVLLTRTIKILDGKCQLNSITTGQ